LLNPWLKPDTLIVTPGDRTDILLAAACANLSNQFPSVSGIVLTGGIKPQPIVLGSMRSKVANIGAGGSGFGGGGIGGPGSGNTGAFGSGLGSVGGSAIGSGGNFYSPELSTDFLELPQSLDEQRNYFRFFYRADPFVGQAMDIHRELPLSKIRLGRPDIFIVSVPRTYPVALDTRHFRLQVRLAQLFLNKGHVADVTPRIDA